MKFKLRRYFLYYLGRCLSALVYAMPASLALALADAAGAIAFGVLPKYREITLSNLRSVFGSGKTEAEVNKIARQVFKNLARNAVELVRFPRISASNIDALVSIEGRDILDRELSKGRGAIVVTGHFGNWELMPVTLRVKGYSGAVVGRKIYFDKYDRYLNSLRTHHGVEIIYRDESPRRIIKVLRSGGIVGMVADQDVDSVEGVFVDFLGRKAYTPAGPAALAKATGAPLIPAVMVRQGAKHRLVFDRAVELADTGDKEADLMTDTQRWSDAVASYIRRYPDHWVWMHRRWKTKEPDRT